MSDLVEKVARSLDRKAFDTADYFREGDHQWEVKARCDQARVKAQILIAVILDGLREGLKADFPGATNNAFEADKCDAVETWLTQKRKELGL